MKQTITILAALTATILIQGCNDSKQECYRDDTFEAMLSDSTFMHSEWELTQDSIYSDAIFFVADWEQPLLCPPNADSLTLIMTNWYNFCERVNANETDIDTYERYWDEIDNSTDLLYNLLASWRHISFIGIHDTFALRRLKEARDVDTEGRGDAMRKNCSDVAKYLSGWIPTIDSAYMADIILPQLNPQNYLPSTVPEISETYIGSNANPSDEALHQLYADYSAEPDFNARMAYLFTLLGTKNISSDTLAQLLCDAEDAMQSGLYSPLMPLVWRAYRIGYTMLYSCPSTYCYVPNIRFNYYRRLIAYTYLCHIQNNPSDTIAQMQYAYLAYRDNVNRFGPFHLGNQIATEYIYLFRNKDWL